MTPATKAAQQTPPVTETCSRAHAHARSADAIAIAGYLGSGDTFDKAVTEFAFTYADQNDRDHAAFIAAIDNGNIEAVDG